MYFSTFYSNISPSFSYFHFDFHYNFLSCLKKHTSKILDYHSLNDRNVNGYRRVVSVSGLSRFRLNFNDRCNLNVSFDWKLLENVSLEHTGSFNSGAVNTHFYSRSPKSTRRAVTAIHHDNSRHFPFQKKKHHNCTLFTFQICLLRNLFN